LLASATWKRERGNLCAVNGQKYFGGAVYAKGTNTYSTTVTINSYIGATINVAFQDYSFAGDSSGGIQNNCNVANAELNISMQARTYRSTRAPFHRGRRYGGPQSFSSWRRRGIVDSGATPLPRR
jgi:hypothetical protein